MITVRCLYCNGRFDRIGSSHSRFCSSDCEWWATHDEWWDAIAPPAQPKSDHKAEVIAWPLQ